MKRHDYDWQYLLEAYEGLFGKDSFIVSEDNSQAYVTSQGAVLAIFQKTKLDDEMTMHIRSSLTPNAAAYVAMHGFLQENFRIGENFAIDTITGEWLYGIEAMEMAKNNPELMWAVTIELAKNRVNEKKSKKADTKSDYDRDVQVEKKDKTGRLLN